MKYHPRVKYTTGAVIFFLILNGFAWAGPRCGGTGAFCVGLVTDVGTIDDKSFNQSTWEGLQQAGAEPGVHIKYIETRDAKDYMANIDLFARNGYQVIVTVGFGLGEATIRASQKYPDIHFIGVDQYQPKTLKNVAGLVFHEDQAGFEAGALAALLSKSGVIAAVFGTDLVPPVAAFNRGYRAGARHINPGIKIISTFHPGGLDVAFNDPEWGASTAKQAIDQGADVIFSAGGTTGNGGLIESAAHKNVYCIGVDTDQWNTLPESRPCLVSCAMKRITPAIVELIKLTKTGKFPGGNFYGEVGLAPFHAFEPAISDAIKEKLIRIERGLKSGTLRIVP